MPKPENLKPPWKPGQSGNPKGKKKGTLAAKTILREFLAVESGSKHPKTGQKLNCYQHALLACIKKAMNGDLSSLKEIIDRLEGKPNQKVDITERKPDELETLSERELREKSLDIINKLKENLDKRNSGTSEDK